MMPLFPITDNDTPTNRYLHTPRAIQKGWATRCCPAFLIMKPTIPKGNLWNINANYTSGKTLTKLLSRRPLWNCTVPSMSA